MPMTRVSPLGQTSPGSERAGYAAKSSTDARRTAYSSSTQRQRGAAYVFCGARGTTEPSTNEPVRSHRSPRAMPLSAWLMILVLVGQVTACGATRHAVFDLEVLANRAANVKTGRHVGKFHPPGAGTASVKGISGGWAIGNRERTKRGTGRLRLADWVRGAHW
jgi:hypothetical protein